MNKSRTSSPALSKAELAKKSLESEARTQPRQVAGEIGRAALIGFVASIVYLTEKSFSLAKKHPRISIPAGLVAATILLGATSNDIHPHSNEPVTWVGTPCVGEANYTLPDGNTLWQFINDGIPGINPNDVTPIILQIDRNNDQISRDGNIYPPNVEFIAPERC